MEGTESGGGRVGGSKVEGEGEGNYALKRIYLR